MADFFISHASEDKDLVARPIAEALRDRGYDVWYDEFSLTLGDSLRREIDRGLATCRFGVVILSPHFFSKEWPQRELDGLTARETSDGMKRILPVWHDITRHEISRYSPTLADRFAADATRGTNYVIDKILQAVVEGPSNISDSRDNQAATTRHRAQHPYRVKLDGDRLARVMVPFRPPTGKNIPPGFQRRLNQIAAEVAGETAVKNADGTYSYPVHVRGTSDQIVELSQKLQNLQLVTDISSAEVSEDQSEAWFEYHGSMPPSEMKVLLEKRALVIVQCGATFTIDPSD